MKRTYSIVYLIIVLVAMLGFAGCSSDTETTETVNDTDHQVTSDEPELLTVKDTIEYNLNYVMNRLRYNDKSGLYDNEFEYMRAQTSFDEYLKQRSIVFARVDSLTSLEATSVTMFGHDSADVELIVHFDGPSGKHTEFPDRVLVYYHNGSWIKPTVSTIDAQVEWEKSSSN